MVTKASFLPKSVGAPLGAKMAFPGNVRIITVPSGAGAPSAAAAAAAAAAAKVVQTGHGNAAASLPQATLFFMPLHSKSIQVSDTQSGSSIGNSKWFSDFPNSKIPYKRIKKKLAFCRYNYFDELSSASCFNVTQ